MRSWRSFEPREAELFKAEKDFAPLDISVNMWYKRGVRAAEFAAELSKAEKTSAPLDISVNVWYKRGVRAAEFAAKLSKAEKTSAPP